jgi:hypothetical protein
MFARALIVLLAVANLGVALWWALQPGESKPAIATDTDDGAPRLRLIGEAGSIAPPAPVAVAPTVAAPTAQCFAFGPFDAAGYATARAHLQAQVETSQLRAEDVSLARGWRVWLPGQPDRVAANALAARIAAAGFNDYFVMPDGGEPNAIALGRFRGEGPARERAQALRAAGFPAQAEPLLPAGAARWLELRAGPGFDAESQRVAMGAAQAQPLDCTRLPPPSR